ncbi:FAD-binding oxidoreductase [Hymenobacter sp. H14-R3]|uniref:FAD-binding oxidoreductase n=1 Tax=Hymenobacter sp. H14-R3 TaxID=3046308 RepID=UPI0024BB267E|nr:FAD-binding oxidoreductase [Hymenobacter sp. H14-R3]MDJ0367483.1 FAD-binding oxidoreductase [Hymenobacter sp. H14-R3]
MHTPPTSVATLRAALTGLLLLPGDAGYDEARAPWLRVIDQHPALVVEAANVADLVLAITYARTQGLPLGVQATGHGIAKACDGGLLLKLDKLNAIDLDTATRRVRMGPGVSWKDLLTQTQPHGLVGLSGQVSSVGVIGYTLGGGIGWLVRKHGECCEYVVGATVVLASGEIVHASATEHPDLFWGLRGGGGNLGVVAELELQLVAEPHDMLAGLRWYPMARVAELLPLYRDWAATLSQATSTVFRLMRVPDAPQFPASIRGKSACIVGLCHADPATQAQVLASLAVFGEPALDQVKMMAYPAIAAAEPASHESSAITYDQAGFLRELSDEAIALLVEIGRSEFPPLLQLEILQLGGHLTPSVAGPLPSQASRTPTAAFMLHTVTMPEQSGWEEVKQVTEETFARLAPVLTGELYYNYLRGDQQVQVAAAFTESSWLRLREVKRRYDPENLFRFNLNVEPAE